MLSSTAIADIRKYIKRRIAYARYRENSVFYKTNLTDLQILDNGTVRAQLAITPGVAATIDRVELYNTDGQLWAYQNCNITISTEQPNVLYWFDFSVVEQEDGDV